MKKYFREITIVVLLLVVLTIGGVASYGRLKEIQKEEHTAPPVYATQVVLDCQRPEGRKIWKLDSVTFYKDLQLTLNSGDINDHVDASTWLCSISSQAK